MGTEASVARAEARLRSADPLAGGAPQTGGREGLARVLAAPRQQSGRRRGRASVVGAAVGAAGLLALAALVAALLLTTRDRDTRMASTVAPVPLRYDVADRAQTDAERSLGLPPSANGVARKSVRLADEGDGVRFVLFRDPSGDLCMYAVAANGASGGGCGYPGRPGLQQFSAAGLFGGRLAYGLVPDGITTVVVNGVPVPVRNNVFHTVLPASTPRASVDFLTDRGVVSEWHEDSPVRIPPPTPPPSEPFGAQARLLQTKPPYVGVSCPKANSLACDRVGITVWLRKPALRVVAKLWGRRIVLDNPMWSGPARNGRRTRFAGFLQPAGLTSGPHRVRLEAGTTRWLGDPPATVPVIILVYATPGSAASAAMRVRLHPGWG